MNGDKTVFVDTNVFLYTIDGRSPRKQNGAREWVDSLWTTGAGRLSWQVLNEFYANAERLGATAAVARKNVETLAQWPTAAHGLGVLRRAWHWIDSAQISFWDGLILASAEILGCTYLLSEDFQEGRKFGEVTVVNPFKTSPQELGFAPARRD